MEVKVVSDILRHRAIRLALHAQRWVGAQPRSFCLITGPPRSGTTALCRWLTAQNGIVGLPETRVLVAAHALLKEIDRFHRLHERERVLLLDARRFVENFYARRFVLPGRILVDKEPIEPIAFPDRDYPAFLGNVRRLFPEAKLIFMVRPPLDTLWSMSQRTWGISLTTRERQSFPLDHHIRTWNEAMEVVAVWQADPNVYVCSFDEFVTEPAAESARIRDFLGLGPGPAFTPRETKTPGFSADEQAQILEQTAAAWSVVFPGPFNGSPQTDTVAVAQGRSAAE